MTEERYLTVFLALTIIAQDIFWAFLCKNLIDRLMSRNYLEFAQGRRHEKDKPEPQTQQPFQMDAVDPESERQAQDLNSLFGIV